MLRISPLLSVFALTGAVLGLPAQEVSYLGQPEPGQVPMVFAPGLVSLPDEYEYGSVFSADGLEFYYGVNVGDRAEIRASLFVDGAWSGPEVLVGHSRFSFNDPMLSPDGQRLFFISDRPLGDAESEAKDHDIWYIERNSEGWDEPVNLGEPVNSSANEYYMSFASTGRIYFASNRSDRERREAFDLYSSDPRAGTFTAPRLLPGEVNTRHYEADAFVAADESYIIFSSSRPDGLGQGDLYVSFRAPDGTWSAGRNMGPEINTAGHELCPFVTADGRFLFFTSNRDIYWVDSAVIEKVRRAPKGSGR